MKAREKFLVLLIAVFFGFTIYTCQTVAFIFKPPPIEDIRPVLRDNPGPFYVLSASFLPAFPTALEFIKTNPWAGRLPFLFPLPTILQVEDNNGATPYADWLRRVVREDMEKNKPKIVFVPGPLCRYWPFQHYVKPLDWLLKDPAFRKIWKNYRRQRDQDCMMVYRRDN